MTTWFAVNGMDAGGPGGTQTGNLASAGGSVGEQLRVTDPAYPLTEVKVKEPEPIPVLLLEDMVTLVAVMVKPGVAASIFVFENATRNASSGAARRNILRSCMAESFRRALYTVPCN